MSQITREQMLQVFENRCSTRYYDPNKKISQEDFAAILEFARLSPSSVGSEPWKFLVIQNKALRDKLKPFSWGMQYQLDDCSHLVIILAKKNARYDTPFFRDVAKRRGLQGEQLEKALAKYKGLQEVEMKTAESERALFIEGFNYDKMNEVLAAEGLFDPSEWGVSVAATFGYRARDITKKSRRPIEEIVTWVE